MTKIFIFSTFLLFIWSTVVQGFSTTASTALVIDNSTGEGSIPLMVLMQMYYDNYSNGWIIGNIFKLFLIISLSVSIWLNISQLFIMGYAILLFLAFALIFGFLANIISRKYNNTLSSGLANGIALAWTFSTALPLYVN